MRKGSQSKRRRRELGWWTKFSLLCLKYWPLMLVLWLVMLFSSGYIYTQLIAKEGFPNISDPVATVALSRLSDSAQLNDDAIGQPLSETLSQIEGVTSVSTIATANGVQSFVFFESEVDGSAGQERIKQALEEKGPPANFKVDALSIGKYLGEYDMLVAIFDRSGGGLEKIQAAAEAAAEQLKQLPELEDARIIPLIVEDDVSGSQRQIGFNMIGLAPGEDAEAEFYQAVHVGIVRAEASLDALELRSLIENELPNLDFDAFDGQFEALIVEDLAESVKRNVNNLEGNLLTGLIVISLVSLLLISWRAALVVAIFMVSVLAATVLILFSLGYSLNLITLFALILALGLLVDDAVIMVEALDVVKQPGASDFQVVRRALDKILLASLSGTLTTVLVFVPLAFVEGVLGEFIRFIPITMILTLLISFVFSITLIPVWAKFSILREKPDSLCRRYNPILRLEKALAGLLAGLPLLLKRRPAVGRSVMGLILVAGLGLIFYSFGLFGRINVNIFPPLDDSDSLVYSLSFPDGYSLEEAERDSRAANEVLKRSLGDKVVRVNYLTNGGLANERQLQASVLLRDLSQRQVYSPILVEQLQQALDDGLPAGVQAFVRQDDVGPPTNEYPLRLPIKANNLEQAERLAGEISIYLTGRSAPTIALADGSSIAFEQTRLQPGGGQILRLDQNRVVNLEVKYDRLAVNDQALGESEALIKERFSEEYLELNGYDKDLLSIELPETSFEESFNSMFYIFPLAILMIYLLLWWQFKSLLQPLIILVALPFAVVGVANWLHLSDSPFSFNVTIGLIALLGIAVNNSILLTAYANAARKQGLAPVEAISLAVRERFRPLIMTTLTTTLALLPLALNDFFWRQLAWTIIWGLAGSTLLVLFIFPYCYLAAVRLAPKKPPHGQRP